MAILASLYDGRKIVSGSGTADNSGGAAAADVDATITLSELEAVESILGIIVRGSGGPYILRSYSMSGNTVTVTVNVPAGQTATVEVVVLGH